MMVDERWIEAQERRKEQYLADIERRQRLDAEPAVDPATWIVQGNMLMSKSQLYGDIAAITNDPAMKCQAAIYGAQVKLWQLEADRQHERTELAIKYSKYNQCTEE